MYCWRRLDDLTWKLSDYPGLHHRRVVLVQDRSVDAHRYCAWYSVAQEPLRRFHRSVSVIFGRKGRYRVSFGNSTSTPVGCNKRGRNADRRSCGNPETDRRGFSADEVSVIGIVKTTSTTNTITEKSIDGRQAAFLTFTVENIFLVIVY